MPRESHTLALEHQAQRTRISGYSRRVRFTVLGKSPAWEDAGGACSGYLVSEGEYKLLLDCGNGVFGKLRELIAYTDVDELLLSHLHADHCLDLVPFAYALTLGAPPPGPEGKPPLHVPPGTAGKLRELVSIWGSSGLFDDAFALSEYELAGELALGPLRARLHPVPHFTLTHAVELTAPSGARLVFGADCRYCEELIEAARGAEVLLAEATLPEPEPESVALSERGHMSASEAGALAAEAGVGRLVLTHISDQLDPERALAQAEEAFAGPVEIATFGSSWEL